MEQPFGKYWYSPSQAKSTKGIFLLLHGLNLKPERMSGICDILTLEGYRVFCPPLTCHRADEDNLALQKEIKSSQWLSDFHGYYNYLSQLSNEKIHIAAFSLGGAVALNYLLLHKPNNIGKLILIEPATQLSLQLKLFLRLSKMLGINKGFGIPSSNLPDYRMESSTSIAAYQALNTLGFDGVTGTDLKYIKNREALVILESKSEAISVNKARKIFESFGWKVEVVSNKLKNNTHPVFKWIKPTIRHLIIDENVTDAHCWKQIREAIIKHIQSE